MPWRRTPSPAYWEDLYTGLAVSTVAAVLLLVSGDVAAGLVLLAVTAALALVVLTYRRRTTT